MKNHFDFNFWGAKKLLNSLGENTGCFFEITISGFSLHFFGAHEA